MNNDEANDNIALVTGAAGFIGFHVAKTLLEKGWTVIGVDCLSDYYDVSLKANREKILQKFSTYHSVHDNIEKPGLILDLFQRLEPRIVIHLAAQAGVRHSIENPRDYLQSNIVGTFEILEAARTYRPDHLLIASTSSVYGASTQMPYRETANSDLQMSFYAASKKATENISHSYCHLFHLPITMFRFFTVYGPWGRPDMALHKFTDAILHDRPIDVYNFGEMKRDFTYIDDLVAAILHLINFPPETSFTGSSEIPQDSKSPVAPFRVVNIGAGHPERLVDFITEIEICLGKKAIRNLLPIQPGDVPSTWAENSLLHGLTGYSPSTSIKDGIKEYIDWHISYYEK